MGIEVINEPLTEEDVKLAEEYLKELEEELERDRQRRVRESSSSSVE